MKLTQTIKDIGPVKVPTNLVSTFKAKLLNKQNPTELLITKDDIANNALMSVDLRVFGVTLIEVHRDDETGSQLIKFYMG